MPFFGIYYYYLRKGDMWIVLAIFFIVVVVVIFPKKVTYFDSVFKVICIEVVLKEWLKGECLGQSNDSVSLSICMSWAESLPMLFGLFCLFCFFVLCLIWYFYYYFFFDFWTRFFALESKTNVMKNVYKLRISIFVSLYRGRLHVPLIGHKRDYRTSEINNNNKQFNIDIKKWQYRIKLQPK